MHGNLFGEGHRMNIIWKRLWFLEIVLSFFLKMRVLIKISLKDVFNTCRRAKAKRFVFLSLLLFLPHSLISLPESHWAPD